MFSNSGASTISTSYQPQSSSSFPTKYEATYVYMDTISRIFLVLSEAANIKSLNNKTQLPYLFTDKPTPISFEYELKEFTSLDYSKTISYLLTSKEVPTQIIFSFNLTPNTLDNSTLLVFELHIMQQEKIHPDKKQRIFIGCKNACCEMINNIEILLQSNNDNIYNYGSIIIEAPIEVVWNYIVKSKFLKWVYKGKMKIQGNPEEVGSTVVYKFQGEKEVVVKIKVSYICKDESKKKWKYRMIPFDGPFQNQELRYVFVNIEKNKTFLGAHHEFQEQVDIKVMNEVSQKKKKYLAKLKEVIEIKMKNKKEVVKESENNKDSAENNNNMINKKNDDDKKDLYK